MLHPGDFVSTVFLRRKPNGTYRLILNLKDFNWYVNYCHFKMESLEKILTLVTPLCLIVSVDLLDAFLVVLIFMAHRSYLKFIWNGKAYQFRAMPFGLTEAPRKFTKLCKPVLANIREQSYTIAGYLDDFIQCEKTFQLCEEALTYSYNLLVSLGFLPNHDKSMYTPTQRIESLGHIIDSVKMTVSLPESKTRAIVQLCLDAIFHPSFSIRHLTTIIGKLISCFLVLPTGRLHYRSMERLKVHTLQTARGSYNAHCCHRAF